MPWCPQCDEVFPDGARCPRCRASMVEVQDTGGNDDSGLQTALPPLKVPRRMRRAFGMPAPSQPPRHVVGFAMALVLLAGGFVLGRMSGIEPDSPGIRPPRADAGLHTRSRGELVAVRPRLGAAPAEFEVVSLQLKTGVSNLVQRFSAPYGGPGTARVEVTGLNGSTAVVVDADRGRSVVAALPAGRPPLYWLDADQAAWVSRSALLVLRSGQVSRWDFADELGVRVLPGTWTALHQTPTGAVLEGPRDQARMLAVVDGESVVDMLSLPAEADVLAAGDGGRTAVARIGMTSVFVDGATTVPLDLPEGFEPIGASLTTSGDRIAIVAGHRQRERVRQLTIFEAGGRPLLLRSLPEPDDITCRPVPAWDDGGRWAFVAPGDGSVHAYEIGGVSRTAAIAHHGCTLAWGA